MLQNGYGANIEAVEKVRAEHVLNVSQFPAVRALLDQ